MPKGKTVKALTARFRTTATGKLKRQQPGKRHHAEQKTAKRKRQLRKAEYVDHAHTKTYSRLMNLS